MYGVCVHVCVCFLPSQLPPLQKQTGEENLSNRENCVGWCVEVFWILPLNFEEDLLRGTGGGRPI